MSDILDKLGLYDLVGVLLPGTIVTGFSIIADNAFFHSGLSKYCISDDSILFLVVSYLTGILLQEIGNYSYRHLFNKIHRILKRVFNSSYVQRGLLSNEKEGIDNFVRQHLSEADMQDENKIYTFCQHSGGNSEKAEKDLMLGAFSRSLSVYFFSLAIIMFIYAIMHIELVNYVACSIFIFIAIVLWNRGMRFYEKRYVRILRNFYYSHLSNKSD